MGLIPFPHHDLSHGPLLVFNKDRADPTEQTRPAEKTSRSEAGIKRERLCTNLDGDDMTSDADLLFAVWVFFPLFDLDVFVFNVGEHFHHHLLKSVQRLLQMVEDIGQ